MYNSVSIIIPVYNSEKTLWRVYNRLCFALNNICTSYEIIFVDDGSKDESALVIEKICMDDNRVMGIILEKNFGQQNALMCGLKFSSGDYVVTIDDDLQNPPEEIVNLLKRINEGYDVVYGIPALKKHSRFRNIGTWATNSFFNIFLKKPKKIKISSFRVLRKEIVSHIIGDKSSFVYISANTLNYTKNIGNVTVKHDKRKEGKSNYNLTRLITLYTKLFIYYSPLLKQLRNKESKLFEIKKIISKGEIK